ncbi:DAK2 domain-containing protein [Nocardioides sp. AE5]|uniref:DAK2 domain-containing protein n=1 Tax=Nocardioides sp. AE5 TaxID=2962573 RepID=UPI0028810462|nr:DAK2 domain-containing protein [Nocardioides sp. AE5]MDT0202904.1 DAK2 domain-containing protein [Nocardioides sp. AE5]
MQDVGVELDNIVRIVDIATEALSEAREEINALNVFPVPDGDTGTNMFLTMNAAREAIHEALATGADRGTAIAACSRGALLGARGNSGVIFSQMIGAIGSGIARMGPGERYAETFAHSLRAATEASYAAVGTPVEGTMLSVARAASDAAVAAVDDPSARTGDVITAAAQAAREALERTPEQLKALADAGVVDAGGRGLCVILDAADLAMSGRRPVSVPRRKSIPVPLPTNDLTEGGPSYEVMYLLDATDEAIAPLRTTLAGLGDSLVVVGGEGLWNVHVHVDDVGAAIEAGIVAGRPHRVRVTHFAEQIAQATGPRASARTGRAVVAVAAGPGLGDLFTESGAVVVSGGPGNRPSTGMLLEAIESSGAAEVVVLPNDPDSVRVAEVAARTAEESGEIRVAVIPSQAQVQGLAAVAVHEPGRSFDQDVLHMTATARHARHGAVTVAAKQAITMAGPCEPGDVLGVIEGDFAVVGKELDQVAREIIDRLLGGGGEMVTLVAGQDDGGLAERLGSYVEETYPIVDAVVYDGGQERYPLLVAVE